jgi:xanthine dehydrogenase small subunit
VIRFILNETEINTSLPPGMVLLDFIRYHQYLMGTKIGCREGDCGACTVLVGQIADGNLEYRSMTSCLVPLANAHGKHIVTVEGINFPGGELNPIQKAMADEGATQCGFCTPGFVMSLAAFCLNDKEATKENAIAAVDGNICRCTGYKSIERACGHVAETMKEKNGKKILPEYFSAIKKRIWELNKSDGQLRTPDSELPTIIGGGTDLYVQKHDELKDAQSRFVFDHPELNGISKEGNKIFIGPSATVTDLKNSEIIKDIFPEFDRHAWLVSSTPIRNMATIAGNFVNASPIGDFTIFFLALNAHLTLALSTNGEEKVNAQKRELALRDFYKGYKQLDKKPGEHIEKIWFDAPSKNFKFNFEKVSKRTNLDIASVNSAFTITIDGDKISEATISAGGVGPTPLYLKKASEFLRGKKLAEELIHEAIEIAQTEISPISDARGSAEYKRLLLGQLLKAHFIKLFPELKSEKLLITS